MKTTNKVYKTHTGFDNGKVISEVKIRDIKIEDKQIFARNNILLQNIFLKISNLKFESQKIFLKIPRFKNVKK